MTESQPEPTTENAAAATDASPVAATTGGQLTPVDVKLDKTAEKSSLLKKLWWVPGAFLIPFAATYINLMTDVHAKATALDRATYIGAIGLAAAVLIHLVWYLDCNYGARQFFGRSKDTAAKILICSLGIALWLTWTCVGIAMSMSYEQVNVPAIYH